LCAIRGQWQGDVEATSCTSNNPTLATLNAPTTPTANHAFLLSSASGAHSLLALPCLLFYLPHIQMKHLYGTICNGSPCKLVFRSPATFATAKPKCITAAMVCSVKSLAAVFARMNSAKTTNCGGTLDTAKPLLRLLCGKLPLAEFAGPQVSFSVNRFSHLSIPPRSCTVLLL
jgi:hypothetical protein